MARDLHVINSNVQFQFNAFLRSTPLGFLLDESARVSRVPSYRSIQTQGFLSDFSQVSILFL